MGSTNSSIGAMLLELCVTELEDTTNSTQTLSMSSHPVVQESSHPYVDDVTLRGIIYYLIYVVPFSHCTAHYDILL